MHLSDMGCLLKQGGITLDTAPPHVKEEVLCGLNDSGSLRGLTSKMSPTETDNNYLHELVKLLLIPGSVI